MAASFYTTVTCSPPLGQLTLLPLGTKQVHFTLVIECGPDDGAEVPWEVVVRHRNSAAEGLKASDWASFTLQKSRKLAAIVDERESGAATQLTTRYCGTLPVQSFRSAGSTALNECFTIQYRVSPQAHWHYVSHDFGVTDGELVVQQPLPAPPSIQSYLQLGSSWTCEKRASTDAAAAFLLESSTLVPRPTGNQDAQFQDLELGRVSYYARWFAIVRYQEMWIGPRQGRKEFFLSEPALLVSFLAHSGHHFTIVALNGVGNVQVHLHSQDGDTVVVSARNDGKSDAAYRVLAAVSLDLDASIAAAMAAAQELIASSKELALLQSTVRARVPSLLQPQSQASSLGRWYNGLAFCTYNSLGLDLSTDRILGALDSLAKVGIYPPTLIIDDNWQTIGNPSAEGVSRFRQGMKRFEANDVFFPEGLKAAVSRIRSQHSHIEDIAVWHALLGYWAGIEPGSELTEKYQTVNVKAMLIGHQPSTMTAIDPSQIIDWYDDFYSFLSSCGVTGVKTDVQCQLDLLTETSSRASFTAAYQAAWTAAHLRHFSGKAISCMSMIPQILFHQFQVSGTPKIMLRNSDDFYPEFPTSHLLHVFVNAHNALFTGNLNALPDWDMFQTKQEFGRYHAAARCLSGGPIYVTDSPGEHDVELIHQMTGLSPDGRTVAIQPDSLGRAIWAYDKFADGKPLKIGTKSRQSTILGIFNNAATEARYLLPISDMQAFDHKGKILITTFPQGKLIGPCDKDSTIPDDVLYLKLPDKGFSILTGVPVETVSDVSVAILGLQGKMVGVAAVSASTVTEQQGHVNVQVSLSVLGEFGIWVQSSRDFQVEAKVEGQKITPSVAELETKHQKLVKIDTFKVWSDLNMRDMKKTEIGVELIIS